METENPLITHYINLTELPLDPHTLPLSNGINYSDEDDIEMVALQSMSYTSLKDLLPLSSPPSVASPTNNSWREIPIKDPLVQHAAWAYLQPMAEARDEDYKWWGRFEKKCCWLLGCFNDVVMVAFNGWFAEEENGGDDRVDRED